MAWALVLHVQMGSATEWLHNMAIAGISINLMLIALNLLPIPPLDGSRVVSAWLPDPLAYQYNRLEPYGFLILIGLMLMNGLMPLIMPIFVFFKDVLFTIMRLG
jgi:Zn-dependent protease